MAKKNNRLVINIPKSLITQVADLDFIPNGDGSLFFHNNNVFKRIKKSGEGLITQHQESRLLCATVGNGSVRATYEVELTELERLVREAKKKEKYFKKLAKKKNDPELAGRFYIHFNPELSFFIKK